MGDTLQMLYLFPVLLFAQKNVIFTCSSYYVCVCVFFMKFSHNVISQRSQKFITTLNRTYSLFTSIHRVLLWQQTVLLRLHFPYVKYEIIKYMNMYWEYIIYKIHQYDYKNFKSFLIHERALFLLKATPSFSFTWWVCVCELVRLQIFIFFLSFWLTLRLSYHLSLSFTLCSCLDLILTWISMFATLLLCAMWRTSAVSQVVCDLCFLEWLVYSENSIYLHVLWNMCAHFKWNECSVLGFVSSFVIFTHEWKRWIMEEWNAKNNNNNNNDCRRSNKK